MNIKATLRPASYMSGEEIKDVIFNDIELYRIYIRAYGETKKALPKALYQWIDGKRVWLNKPKCPYEYMSYEAEAWFLGHHKALYGKHSMVQCLVLS